MSEHFEHPNLPNKENDYNNEELYDPEESPISRRDEELPDDEDEKIEKYYRHCPKHGEFLGRSCPHPPPHY